ncbi:MAG: hypothetical protein ACE15C_10435 [Phycisphaerae bacterium]
MDLSGPTADFERLAIEYLRQHAPDGQWGVATENPDELRISEAQTPSPWYVPLTGTAQTAHMGKCRGIPGSSVRTWADVSARLDDIIAQWRKGIEEAKA